MTTMRAPLGAPGGRQTLSYIPPPMGLNRVMTSAAPPPKMSMMKPPTLSFGNFGITGVSQSRSYVPPSTQPQQQEDLALPTVPFWCGIGENKNSGVVEIYGLQEHLNELKKHNTFSSMPRGQIKYINPEVGADFNAEEQVKKEMRIPTPTLEALPKLPQYIMRICFCDPEGIVVWNSDKDSSGPGSNSGQQLIGSSESNLRQLKRLQGALGENSKFVLCMSEGVRASLGEHKFHQIFKSYGIRVDAILDSKDVQIDLNLPEVSVQQFAVEKLKTNRCAEIHSYLEEQIKVPYHFCIIQTWGGKERFGILDSLPVQEMAERVIQPKNFVIDAKEIVMHFLEEMSSN